MVIKESQQVALEAVYLQCRIWLQDLGETVIFKALVVPYLGCFDQSDKCETFPIFPAELISTALAEQPEHIGVGEYGHFLLHFSSHHYQLDEVFNIFSAASPACFILVGIVEARQIHCCRLFLEVKHLRAALKVRVATILATNRDGLVDIVVKDGVFGEVGLRLDQALLQQLLDVILVGLFTFFWVETRRAEVRLYLDGIALYDFLEVDIGYVGSQRCGIK